MKKCMPSCCKKTTSSSSESVAINGGGHQLELPSEQQVVCRVCHTLQSVSKEASVFVCLSCHTVNRLNSNTAEAVVSSLESTSPVLPEITLRRINSSTFVPTDQFTQTSSVDVHTPSAIGPCSVCMDGAGDMIFLNCHHGGFCEPCARHIAQNMAVGGSHCPRCREPIVALARIVKVQGDVVKAVSVEVQTALTAKAPPKVPAPRGFNKVKKQ